MSSRISLPLFSRFASQLNGRRRRTRTRRKRWRWLRRRRRRMNGWMERGRKIRSGEAKLKKIAQWLLQKIKKIASPTRPPPSTLPPLPFHLLRIRSKRVGTDAIYQALAARNEPLRQNSLENPWRILGESLENLFRSIFGRCPPWVSRLDWMGTLAGEQAQLSGQINEWVKLNRDDNLEDSKLAQTAHRITS